MVHTNVLNTYMHHSDNVELSAAAREATGHDKCKQSLENQIHLPAWDPIAQHMPNTANQSSVCTRIDETLSHINYLMNDTGNLQNYLIHTNPNISSWKTKAKCE